MSFDRGAPALWFVEIFLDAETLRLCNAFEAVDFDGQTYTPFGDRMRPPADIDRTASLKSQKFSIGFDSSRQTDNDDPIGIILDSNWRRRPVRVRYAVGDMGAAAYDFSDAFILIDEAGRIKDTEDKIAAGRMPEIEIEIESGALIFLERRNQTRSPANQRAAFPGDAFFDYALKLDGVVLPWRTKKARNGKVQITYDIEGAAPREMLIGRGMTKGSFVFGATGGQQRKYWAQVYALADHRCEALEEIWINGTPVLNGASLTHGTRTALSAFASGGTRLWVTWYDGRHDQTADSYLISLTAGQPLPWTSNHRGRGVSYCIIEHLWDSDNPESYSYEFQLRGARIYQERFDTTAGGSGAQRWNDPDTWAYTTNPADAWRHFLRGRVLAPSSSAMWFGVGADVAFLDPYATYAAQAAHCDDLIALKLGGTQKRYEANGWITADTDHKTNLQKLADCAVADAVDEGSRVSIRLSEPQTPVIELTDEDLDEAAESVIGANARSDDVVNRVEGRFQDPANKFQAVDYPAISDGGFEEIDGAEISETWNQPLEISEERAQRKALLFLNKRRRTVEIEERLGPKAKIVRPGDWLTRSSELRGFPGGKLFIADEVRRFIDGTVRLILLEVDPAELVWDEENAELTPAADDPEIENEPLGVPDIAVSAISIAAGDVTLPAVRFTITDFADAMGDEVIVEFGIWNGVSGGGAAIVGASSFHKIPGNVATFDGLVGLLPGTGYAFRFQARDGERFSSWSTFRTAVMTGTYQAGRSAIADGIVGQGWGATASAADASNALVPVGANLALDTGFRAAAGLFWDAGFASGAGSITFASASGIRYAQLAASGVAANSNYRFGGTPQRTVPVVAGDKVEVSFLFGGTTGLEFLGRVYWYNAAGSFVAATTVGSFLPITLPGGGDVTSYHFSATIHTAPSGAAWGVPQAYVRHPAGGTSQLRVAAPFIARVPANQTATSPLQINNDFQPGADPTGANNAAGIIGQGPGATASGPAVLNDYVPAYGANIIRSTNLPNLSKWVTLLNSTGLSATLHRYTDSNSEAYIQLQATGTATGAHQLAVGNSESLNRINVTAGQRYEVSADLYFNPAGAGASSRLLVVWRDAAGNSISDSLVGTSTTNGAWVRISGFVTAPANAASAVIYANSFTVSGQVNPFVAFRRPFMSRARTDQITLTPYIPGAEADLNSDVTGANNAAGIIGQGALATLNSVDTAQIASGAVSDLEASTNDSSTNPGTSDTYTSVISQSIVMAAGDSVVVQANAQLGPAGTPWGDGFALLHARARILRGATVLREIPETTGTINAVFLDVDTPGAGTFTYTLEVKYRIVGSGSTPTPSVTNRSIVLTRLRR